MFNIYMYLCIDFLGLDAELRRLRLPKLHGQTDEFAPCRGLLPLGGGAEEGGAEQGVKT